MWGYKRPLYIHSYYEFNMSTGYTHSTYVWLYIYIYIYTCITLPTPPPPPQTSHPYIYPISLTLHTLTGYVHILLIYHITLPPPMWPSTHCLFQPVFPWPTPLATTTPPPLAHLPILTWSINLMMPICHYLQPILSHPPSFPFPLPIPSHHYYYLPKVLMLVTISNICSQLDTTLFWSLSW